MRKMTAKAKFFAAAFLAAMSVATSTIAAAQGADFNLGDIAINQKLDGRTTTDTSADAVEPKPVEPATPQPVIVTVKKGDTLGKIAKSHNTEWKRLYDANAFIADPDIINPGEQIRIPFPDEAVAARPLPATGPAAKPSSPRNSGGTATRIVDDGSVWYRLALCESGGRPNAVSANGLYHGLYQFLPSTWRAVGGSGLPSQASPEEQTMRAQMLQARSGWGQWPACARKLGLL